MSQLYYANGQLVTPPSLPPPYIGNTQLWTTGLTNSVLTVQGGNVLVRCKVPSTTTGQRVLTIPNPIASGNMIILRGEAGNEALYNYLVQTVTPGTYPIIGAPGTATLMTNYGVLRLLDATDNSGWGAA